MYVDMTIIVRFLQVTKAWGTLARLFFLSTAGETEAQKTSYYLKVAQLISSRLGV